MLTTVKPSLRCGMCRPDKRRSSFASAVQVKRVHLRALQATTLPPLVCSSTTCNTAQSRRWRLVSLWVFACFLPVLTSVCLGLVDYSEAPPVLPVLDCTGILGQVITRILRFRRSSRGQTTYFSTCQRQLEVGLFCL
jgi:hypothetical protein